MSHVSVIFIYIDVPCTRRILVYNIYIYMYVYYIQYIYNLYNYSTYVYGIYNLHIMSDHPRGLDASQYPSCKGGPRVWNPWQTSGTGVPRGYHRVYRNGYRKKWPYVFFCLNLRSYGKSPFLNMVNQRWLAGKSLEVNMQVIAVKIIYFHGPWLPSRTVELPEGTFYIKTGGWHPKWKNLVFRVRAPLQGEVAGVINFGTLVVFSSYGTCRQVIPTWFYSPLHCTEDRAFPDRW